MNTPTHEELNRVLDDLLSKLLERWPKDFVSVMRSRRQHDGKFAWYANTSSQGIGEAETSAEQAVNGLLFRSQSDLLARRESLRAELESVETELAPSPEPGRQEEKP